ILHMAPCLALIVLLLSGASALSRKTLEEPDPRTPVPLTELITLPDEKTVPWGKEVEGLSCRIIATPDAVPGQPVRFTVQVRNNSARVRYIFPPIDIHLPVITRLTITAPNGKPLELAGFGFVTLGNGQPVPPRKVGDPPSDDSKEAPAPNFKPLKP